MGQSQAIQPSNSAEIEKYFEKENTFLSWLHLNAHKIWRTKKKKLEMPIKIYHHDQNHVWHKNIVNNLGQGDSSEGFTETSQRGQPPKKKPQGRNKVFGTRKV